MSATLDNVSTSRKEEAHKLLVEWNETRTDYPRHRCIHQLFEEQVERRPQATALLFRNERLTYEQLNQKANKVAHHLRRLGVGPEVMVGTLLERSLEMVVGLLGILKAGGAFVPLDANYPTERLTFMASDAKLSVMLVQSAALERMEGKSCSAATLVRMDGDVADLNSQSGNNPTHVNSADNLAYVMYTSGSTGRPKGVMVDHRAVIRLVKNINYIDLGEQEVFLQFSPISFDASTLEIWAPLLNGGCLAIMPPETQSLDEIGAAIRRYGVTSMWLAAGLFNVMVERRLDDLRPLRQLLVGGDALSPAHIRKAIDGLPDCRLINGYGPTEGTTFSCCHTITREDALGTSIPIGKPISNTQIYLLDSSLLPVSLGEPGELWVGGDGLARGYLNQPELTAERFVPHPFSDEPGARVYRTGDLARYRSDGTIEFLGRVDDQVKVSGFRVEPGEIETVLMEHPSVQSVAVVARQELPGEKKLAAYVVFRTQGGSEIELRAFLQKKLPAYMVPSEFVALSCLPLSPNGKVDRRALPALQTMLTEVKEAVSPQTNLEQQIAAIWRRVLCLEQVSVDDNFFDLGGDSLQLLDAHAELKTVVSSALTIIDMFEYTTISALAKYLAKSVNSSHIFEAHERARKQQLAWAQHRPSQIQNS